VKPGPTNVTLVTIRFHCLAERPQDQRHTLACCAPNEKNGENVSELKTKTAERGIPSNSQIFQSKLSGDKTHSFFFPSSAHGTSHLLQWDAPARQEKL
jgi:hypothetical protein